MNPTSDRILCHCLRVTEMEIRGAVSTGAVRSVKDVMDCTGAGTGCTACHRRIAAALAQSRQPTADPLSDRAAVTT